MPVPDPVLERSRRRAPIRGDVPNPADPPHGCRFNTRCPYVLDVCREFAPQLVEIEPGHFARCIRISPEQPDIDAVSLDIAEFMWENANA